MSGDKFGRDYFRRDGQCELRRVARRWNEMMSEGELRRDEREEMNRRYAGGDGPRGAMVLWEGRVLS